MIVNITKAQTGYSQFFNNPILYNPANTAHLNEDKRFGISSRNGIIAPSKSFTLNNVFVETKLAQSKIPETDCFGIGFIGSLEKNPDDGVSNTYLSASLSYKKGFDETGLTGFSAGFQVTLGSKTLEKPMLLFESQIPTWINSGFRNIDLSQFGRASFSYLDINAGVKYQGVLGRAFLFSLSTALFHITKPNKIFFGGEFNLNRQLWSTASFEKSFHEGSRLYGLLLVGLESRKFFETNIGVIYEQIVKKGTSINGGLFLKHSRIWGDAIVPIVGICFNAFSINLSYDINPSAKRTLYQKTSELSFIYRHRKNTTLNPDVKFSKF